MCNRYAKVILDDSGLSKGYGSEGSDIYRDSIASRKTGPLSSGPVHFNTGPADIIQKYGTGPVDSYQLDLNCTVWQIVRS